jgi:hypothetical protein
MMRAITVATVVGALTLAAGCGRDDDGAVSAATTEAAAAARAASAAGDGGEGTGGEQAVTFESQGMPRPTLLTTNCNPHDQTDCILPTTYPPTKATGDLRGEAFSASVVVGRNGVYVGSSLIVFTGEVEGCGRGGLVVTTTGTFDPSTGLTKGEWTVDEDGGTGELADVTGGGTTLFDEAGGHFDGRLRCR